MHCDACGVEAQGGLRCRECHAIAAWAMILGMATIAWAVSIALYLVVSRVMFADIARMFAGLGAQLPLAARIYFALSAQIFPAVIAGAAGAPLIVAGMGQRAPERLHIWARRYALTAILGVAWGLLGVAAWYLCFSSVITSLK
jgi:hypothetical protein